MSSQAARYPALHTLGVVVEGDSVTADQAEDLAATIMRQRSELDFAHRAVARYRQVVTVVLAGGGMMGLTWAAKHLAGKAVRIVARGPVTALARRAKVAIEGGEQPCGCGSGAPCEGGHCCDDPHGDELPCSEPPAAAEA